MTYTNMLDSTGLLTWVVWTCQGGGAPVVDDEFEAFLIPEIDWGPACGVISGLEKRGNENGEERGMCS